MHASKAYSNSPNTSSLRTQLLSSDVGSIDVRHETPINGPRTSYPQQQYGAPPPQPGYSPQQYYSPPNGLQPPPQQQYQKQQQQQQPRSRRSSIVSNSSNFNIMKFGRKKKQSASAGDDDDDEDGKDIMLDSTTVSMMSFDDLSSLRDRGRYGMHQQTFDTAPIIPTIHSNGMKPAANSSSTQYRKQMTAMKKQAYTHAGKMVKGGDPRAMSLQAPTGNPYFEGPDSRSNSFTSQGLPHQLMHGPPHPGSGPGSRANSLTQFTPNHGPGPRAYSLTTNPYQQQQLPPQQRMGPGARGPGGPPVQGVPGPYRPQQRPHPQQGYPPQPMNTHRLSAPSIPSPLSGAPQPTPQGTPQQRQSLPHQSPQPQPVPQFSQQGQWAPQVLSQQISTPGPQNGSSELLQRHSKDPLQSSYQQSRQQNLQPVSQQPKSQRPVISQTNRYSIPEEQQQANEQYQGEEVSHSSLDPKTRSVANDSQNHHFLAEKTLTPDDNTTASLNDTSLPNGESTPSPDMARTTQGSQKQDEISPSKLPRIKALPRLSVLSIRDDDDDDMDTQKQRVLEPVQEGSVAQSYPLSSSPVGSESYFQSPDRSPQKKLISSRISPHKNHKNTVSISSMSEYSTVSDANFPEQSENSKKMYQVAQASNTNNDVFVTASQFSFMDHQKRASVSSSVATDTSATPKVSMNRRSVDEASIKSSGSFKGFFKSLSLQKRKEKKGLNGDVFEPVVKQIPIKQEIESREIPMKEPELSSDSTNESSLESKPTTLAESFVPQIQPKSKLGLTVDQLGIMEDKSSIMTELDIVSRELAASIKREIALEFGNNGEREYLTLSLEKTELLQQLNDERKKRYIAEEHVLMLEADSKPSALELSYELDRLRSEMAAKNELINKQTMDIESLKTEVPELKKKLAALYQKNRDLESEIVPKLQNEIEMLQVENKNVSILRERLKIMKNEKEQTGGGNFSFVHEDSTVDQLRPVMPQSSSSKRLASFNLISVATSE